MDLSTGNPIPRGRCGVLVWLCLMHERRGVTTAVGPLGHTGSLKETTQFCGQELRTV
jgi:hypothetical protein